MTAWTLTEAAETLDPPMPRRELARRLKGVAPVGATYARRGRRASTYPVSAIMRAHAEWVREKGVTGRLLADDRMSCQNSALEESA